MFRGNFALHKKFSCPKTTHGSIGGFNMQRSVSEIKHSCDVEYSRKIFNI